jgi:hypothetical protein
MSEQIDKLMNEKEKVMNEAWVLVTKLKEHNYKHPTDQIADMKKVGELAEAAEHIWTAASLLKRHT